MAVLRFLCGPEPVLHTLCCLRGHEERAVNQAGALAVRRWQGGQLGRASAVSDGARVRPFRCDSADSDLARLLRFSVVP
jgi:hypothetical protein